jgi:hypothetical protein
MRTAPRRSWVVVVVLLLLVLLLLLLLLPLPRVLAQRRPWRLLPCGCWVLWRP